jgi:acyl-coenzyme A thioesterase PaaI-like protein
MSTRFMRPGLGHIRAFGELMHATASLAFCEGRVLDDKGEVCAHATATFKYLRALPVSGRQTHSLPASPLRGAGSD